MYVRLLPYCFLFNTIFLLASQGIAHIKLPSSAYQTMAKRVIQNTLDLGKGYPTSYAKNYCEARIRDASALQRIDIEYAHKLLDSAVISFFYSNLIDRFNNIHFEWEFVTHNELLVTHRVRRILRCYTDNLEDFEYSYAHELKKVTNHEYIHHLRRLSTDKVQIMTIEEAARLAAAILHAKK